MAKPTRIIDPHQHVFWNGRDDRGLVADMDEHGIEKAWLLTWEVPPFEDPRGYHPHLNPLNLRSDGTHAGIPLRDLVQTRDRYPDRFLLGYCPHPALGNAPGLLKSAAEIHGVQVCGEWKFRIPFDDPRSLELFYMAGQLKLPVVLHLDVPYLMVEGKRTYQPLWFGGTVDNLERALQACPETIFIGHAPGFWREVSGDADIDPNNYPAGPITPGGKLHGLLERNPNLYADLSAGSGLTALKRDPVHAAQFLHRFADRLLFARDCYGQALHDFLKTVEISEEDTEKIYWQNALGLLD